MKLIKIIAFCLLTVAVASCRKAEFMPVPEGTAIPHTDITITLKDALAASPYTLFKAAWERSDMNAILKEKGKKAPFTLLVPTDAAFIADGLTLDVINKTTPALLDSVLLYHTIGAGISLDDIKNRKDSFKGLSLLQNPNLKVFPATGLSGATFDIYSYLQYIKVQDGTLFVNGKACGTLAPTEAKDGLLWPIDHVLHKPTKTLMEALQEDGRFGMYIELNLRNDALYAELTYGIVTHDFTQGLVLLPYYANYNVTFSSVYAIPDEVFHAAGYQTVDDVMKLNDRNPLPTVDWDAYSVVGGLATDTLVGYHRWGTMFSYYDVNYGRGDFNALNFYTPDLTNDLLGNYTVVTSGSYGTYPIYPMPLDFGKKDGAVTVNVKGSNHPAAKITEPDINTLMGPIHVVDHFMVPKDFKF
ncbi:fasciclin domain-containing protein [Mucilaginibacter rubeus]|uniref:FAS1 domain-containing protein n=1 Tax=Mucilaginibacter rubeus TaxID=2027860 RepID=A0A5C1IAB0_9SPHI|nr:fasciclin domain-containing protein [Mucilaginibacter rubeus]QEM14270.1 hypothetical protein DEO27_031060 [Mucilaginibacter rubeus]